MARTLFTNALLFSRDGRFVRGALLVDGDVIGGVFDEGDALPSVEQAVDLSGRSLLPGFVDAHTHLMTMALDLLRCDLRGAHSSREVVCRLADWAKVAGEAGPVVGVGFDESEWDDESLPTRLMLDGVASDRPVFARRVCGHAGVANSELLKMLKGHERFVDAISGFITEDAVTEAGRVTAAAPEDTVPAVEKAIRNLHAHGITGIHDVVSGHHVDRYFDAIASVRPRIRIDALFCTGPGEFDDVAERSRTIRPGWFRPMGIKLFSDGSFGGRTAALHSPYADAQTIGEFLLTEAELANALRESADRGIACAVHAIGDRSLRAVLQEMLKFSGERELFRIEHAELVGWDELRILERAQVHLVMQPNFVRNWQQPGGLYESRLGKDRWRRCNRFRALRDSGVPFAFSSDAMPSGPLFGARGATHHPVAEERLGLDEVFERYTARAARFSPARRRAGELTPGNAADLIVLSGDRTLGDPDSLRVDETWVGGERVYQREPGTDHGAGQPT